MEPIQFGGNYNYGPNQGVAEQNYTQTQKIPNDSYNPKYKPKKNKKTAGVLSTIVLMAGSAFAAYKGRGKIQKISSDVATTGGKIIKNFWSGFSTKNPNMSTAISSFGKACKTPINAIAKLFHIK